MDVQKASAYAQILALPCAVYCAYGAWAALHPGQELPVSTTALAISFGALVACLVLAVALRVFQGNPTVSSGVEGHRLAEVAFARHWRGQAEGSADELHAALAENLEMTKHLETTSKAISESQSENDRLRQQLADTAKRLGDTLHIPDVSGNVQGLGVNGIGNIMVGTLTTVHCGLDVRMSLYNHGPEAVSICKLTLTAFGDRPCRCLLNMLDKPVPIPPNTTVGFSLTARVEFSEPRSIPRPLVLIATDANNAHHWVPIPVAIIPNLPPESLSAQ
jgi:hypothetical protein